MVFSGEGERFWSQVKPLLKPGDQIATVMDWGYWMEYRGDLPYSILGTANFPAYFQIPCISGYSTTSPTDRIPIKTSPAFWFGAFSPDQVGEILAQEPKLRLIRVKSTHPLRMTMSEGAGNEVDLTPYIDQGYFKAPPPDPSVLPSARLDGKKTTP
jgi:hypothetical protein